MISDLANRITLDPDVLTGKPVIRGMRISVEHILEALAAGISREELLGQYPFLEADDIRAAILYAAERVAEDHVFAFRPAPRSSTQHPVEV